MGCRKLSYYQTVKVPELKTGSSAKELTLKYSTQKVHREQLNEVFGKGNFIDYTFRGYNTRLGRFFAVDPLFKDFPWNSPFAFSENRVIDGIELEGLEFKKVTKTVDFDEGKPEITNIDVEIDQDAFFEDKEGNKFAKTETFIEFKGIKFEVPTSKFFEPIQEENNGLKPSAAIDFTNESIKETKFKEDMNFIFNTDNEGTMIGRFFDVILRDSRAPDNQGDEELIEVLEVITTQE